MARAPGSVCSASLTEERARSSRRRGLRLAHPLTGIAWRPSSLLSGCLETKQPISGPSRVRVHEIGDLSFTELPQKWYSARSIGVRAKAPSPAGPL